MTIPTNVANYWLDKILGAGYDAAISDTNLQLGMSTTIPTSSGGNITEPTAADYVRLTAITNDSTNWPDASASAKTNGVQFTWPEQTLADWGTVTSWVLWKSDGTTFLLAGELTSPTDIPAGVTPDFPVGQIGLVFP
jgi:hypothetical protein